MTRAAWCLLALVGASACQGAVSIPEGRRPVAADAAAAATVDAGVAAMDAAVPDLDRTPADTDAAPSNPDAPAVDARTPVADAGVPADPPGIVGVGYGGIRIVSRDLGRTWSNETHWAAGGGDDKNLLRAVAYGNGIWVAGGWRYVTSADGAAWTDRGLAIDAIKAVRCDITDSLAFGAGRFVVACGQNLATSTDGIAWERLGTAPAVGGHTTLVFDPATGRFGVSGDNDASFVSSDGGRTWTAQDGVAHVRLCKGALRPQAECPAFFAGDVFLSTQWPSVIRRSTDGTRWTNVYDDPNGNTLFTEYAFATGVVGPR